LPIAFCGGGLLTAAFLFWANEFRNLRFIHNRRAEKSKLICAIEHVGIKLRPTRIEESVGIEGNQWLATGGISAASSGLRLVQTQAGQHIGGMVPWHLPAAFAANARESRGAQGLICEERPRPASQSPDPRRGETSTH
jgi:hypothetical protein